MKKVFVCLFMFAMSTALQASVGPSSPTPTTYKSLAKIQRQEMRQNGYLKNSVLHDKVLTAALAALGVSPTDATVEEDVVESQLYKESKSSFYYDQRPMSVTDVKLLPTGEGCRISYELETHPSRPIKALAQCYNHEGLKRAITATVQR